ncbi:glycosyltransferase family 4 protein [bacterium]|nr:glycosyltransferase family 4 protein [candidate division CSSED10-310 bacterium]
MRVAVDGRRIQDGMSGLGIYTLRLLTALGSESKSLDLDITVFVCRKSLHLVSHLRDTVRIVPVPWPVEDHLGGDIWKHITLPRRLNRMSIDVFHDPAYQIPLTKSAAGYVVTVHDLSPFRHPESNTFKYNQYWRFMTRRAVVRASRIIAVSDYIRQEIETLFPKSIGRIDVVPEAAGPDFKPGETDREGLQKLGISGSYFLTAAKYEPRKNLAGCIHAFLDGPAGKFPDQRLVVVGGMGWKNEELLQLLSTESVRERVIVTGYLDESSLINAIRGAGAVIVPSLYEGFGLPVLEAMACGTPVLCSGVSALPEVGGDAALYFDPLDSGSMSSAMDRFLSDAELRGAMRRKGLERSREFSWQKAARMTADVYRRISGS